jgi:hypothetical protein
LALEAIMPFDDSRGIRFAGHQACVIFDRKTGKVAHIHEAITFEGADLPSKAAVEARALELAREFAAKLPGVKFDRLEVLHIDPAELAAGRSVRVDIKARRLVPVAIKRPASRKAAKRPASRKAAKRPASRKATKRTKTRS